MWNRCPHCMRELEFGRGEIEVGIVHSRSCKLCGEDIRVAVSDTGNYRVEKTLVVDFISMDEVPNTRIGTRCKSPGGQVYLT